MGQKKTAALGQRSLQSDLISIGSREFFHEPDDEGHKTTDPQQCCQEADDHPATSEEAGSACSSPENDAEQK
jgi:hypothetical protein